MAYSPISIPFGAMWPILFAKFSVHQRCSSGPTVTPRSEAFGVGNFYSLKVHSRVKRPSAFAPVSTNQIAPSGWVTMARGCGSILGMGYSVTSPSTVMRATRLPAASLNHRSPSLADARRV